MSKRSRREHRRNRQRQHHANVGVSATAPHGPRSSTPTEPERYDRLYDSQVNRATAQAVDFLGIDTSPASHAQFESQLANAIRISETTAAKVIREAPREIDPASTIDGMPPNFGRFVLPQVTTIQGLAAAISKTYRASDEAIQHSYENARFMRNDVGVMECVEARQRSVALLDWHIEPEDKNDPRQVKLASDMEVILRETPNFLKYRECLLHAIWYGRYACQHQYRWKMIGGRMRVAIHRWLPINGDKLVWKIEEDPFRSGESIGIRVGPTHKAGDRTNAGRSKVEVTERGMAYFLEPWERKLIAVHKHMIEDGAYESPWDAGKIHGVGVRSKIYWDWFQKQELLGFLMEYLERAAFGIELWYYPWGNEQAREETENAAKNRISNGRTVVLVPKPLGDDQHAYGVEHIEPGLGGVESLKGILVEYYGHRIKRYILGQTLTSEADATGLGSGVAEIHLGTFLDIVRYDATNLEETITSDVVGPLLAWNFPWAKNVKLRFKIDTESQNAAEKLKGAKEAWEMGARIKEKDVLELVGFSEPTENERLLPGPGGGGGGGAGGAGSPGGPPGMPGMPVGGLPGMGGTGMPGAGPIGATGAPEGTPDPSANVGGDGQQPGQHMIDNPGLRDQ